MSVSKDEVLKQLSRIILPEGGDLVSHDMVRALEIKDDSVGFVLEVPADKGSVLEPVRAAAEQTLAEMEGVSSVRVIMTAHSGAQEQAAPPPDLKIGGHPKPQAGPQKVKGVDRVIAVASGKGGVGKSTVSSNLAVALAKQGRRIGLLDADIYGPSQHRMMGLNKRPSSADGNEIIPLKSHGVTFMSMGLMMKENEAVIWRGPMLMGALQQLLGQVQWGELDALIVDLPPGTGDVQLTLAQKTKVTGAIVVSTPQDIALLDARKALNMFEKTNTRVLGMIENMSVYTCPNCGHEDHIFGHGGARDEAEKLGLPLLGEIPLDVSIRLASDEGTPIAATDGPVAMAYTEIASGMIAADLA